MSRNNLVFGGVNTLDYGVVIDGEAVFDAPERDVEVVTIPGRNGTLQIDNGRFENIEVTYPASIWADAHGDFKTKIKNLRNALASKKGYQRLTDSYYTDEYRLGVFKEGLECDPAVYNTAAEMDLVFDCKPQRFLTSGETEIHIGHVASYTMTNPTDFPAYPIIKVTGYGSLDVNGREIYIQNTQLGNITLFESIRIMDTYTYDEALLNSSDTITIGNFWISFTMSSSAFASQDALQYVSSTIASGDGSFAGAAFSSQYIKIDGAYGLRINIEKAGILFNQGTSKTAYAVVNHVVKYNGTNYTVAVTYQIVFDGINTFRVTVSSSTPAGFPTVNKYYNNAIGPVMANSTVPAYGSPTIIDCELGEAYANNSGDIISLNGYVSLGAELPELSPGTNTIYPDNSISDLSIIPRWWRV